MCIDILDTFGTMIIKKGSKQTVSQTNTVKPGPYCRIDLEKIGGVILPGLFKIQNFVFAKPSSFKPIRSSVIIKFRKILDN